MGSGEFHCDGEPSALKVIILRRPSRDSEN
jgi:hypothetical protein